MKVVKFGGSSLANGEQFQKVVNIINADAERKVIVTSAPGKRFDRDTKVTDLLIDYAQYTCKKQETALIFKQIWARYQEIADYFHIAAEQLAPLRQELATLPANKYRSQAVLLATFKAHGEKLNAQLLTLILQKKQIAARYLDPQPAGFEVGGPANDAHILPQTYQNLQRWQEPATLLVVPGFYGINENGEIATFSRGGSDITGAIWARGLQADLYENFTDVNAIYAANPQIIKHPQAIKVMTYREMRELSYAGFSVFHDEAIIPAIEVQIPINVKSTNHPELPGTMIVTEKEFKPQHVITGVASSNHFSALYLHRYLLNKEVGFTLKLLQIFYKYNISYEHMPSGIDDLTVIFDKRQFTAQVRDQMCNDIRAMLAPDYLEWIDDYAIIMVVGEGMRNKIGVMKNITAPLAQKHVAIHMINQGASRISIMLGTKRADAAAAVTQIYQQFFN
ncbi:aspartate kinase [Lactobacillus xylocopicola]|uniref:Aspartokinase n=1 Tax=Lactobacillus xylocopicola TaxID=2976676 RepID=A0ABN6SLG0_9LACO|nr:aspartate kinase [Lactobacillus xylocopicola]BDR61192.1 aspartokinase [Lactobacillus xylocopicola]